MTARATRVLITVPSKKKLANGRAASVAALEAGPESRGEGYTNPPESSIDPSIPVPFPLAPPPFPHATATDVSPSLHLSARPCRSSHVLSLSHPPSLSRMSPHVSPGKLTRVLRLPYPLHGSFRVLLASADFHGNSFPTPLLLAPRLPIYLSIYPRLLFRSSLSTYSSADLFPGLSLFLAPSRDSLVSFPPYRPPPLVWLPVQTSPSRSMTLLLAPALLLPRLIPPKPVSPTPTTLFSTLVFYFPPLSPRDIPARVPIPLTPSQCSRQTARYLAWVIAEGEFFRVPLTLHPELFNRRP